MTHYRFEGDPAISVNLESETRILLEHQQRLQARIALFVKDLSVVTDVIVERAKNPLDS